jgi:hypothetical protein
MSPVSPMKYISIGVSCRVSYSAIDCLQEPHGGIGAIVLLSRGIAILKFCLRISASVDNVWHRAPGYAASLDLSLEQFVHCLTGELRLLNFE